MTFEVRHFKVCWQILDAVSTSGDGAARLANFQAKGFHLSENVAKPTGKRL
ncbi:hypothetical protein GS625_15560 [Ruegeria sp. HKCCD7319]|nr:hypothetical protein [Ruegeria sp. HKCCD7319]